MAEMYEIRDTLCKGIDNKKNEYAHKVLSIICKVRAEKR